MRLLPKEELNKLQNKKQEADVLLAAKIREKTVSIHKEFNELTARVEKERAALEADYAQFAEKIALDRSKKIAEVESLERRRKTLLEPITEREDACVVLEEQLAELQRALVQEESALRSKEATLRAREDAITQKEKELEQKKCDILELEKRIKQDDENLTEAWASYDTLKKTFDERLDALDKREAQFEYNVKAHEAMLHAMVKANEEEAADLKVKRARLVSDYEALAQAKKEIMK